MSIFEEKNDDSKPDYIKRISIYAGIAGSFSAGLLGLIQIKNYFSPWQIWFFGTILLILAVVTMTYGLIGPWVYDSICRFVKSKKENKIARQFAPKFIELISRFEDICGDNRCNIRRTLLTIRNDNMQIASLCDNNSFDYLFRIFLEFCKTKVKTKNKLILFVKWFESILTTFNDNVIRRPLLEVKNLPNLKLNSYTLEEYENHRETYNAFIRDYCKFMRTMKNKFGDIYLRDHFETPTMLHLQYVEKKQEDDIRKTASIATKLEPANRDI
jgi:hypothetical protein